ncbi:MAG: PIG-L family deacetylase [Ignavibacteriales bacterium]|nr:PIG-L family deacetylase [Ignavibacteriales bacterium]
MARLKTLILTSLLFLCVAAMCVEALPAAPESPQKEIHKIVLDLQNPAVVVFVAMRPGAEDFAALASLRLGQGAKVTTVFVTNGESIPNDAAGESQRLTAGRRKEEAYECATQLGAQAYFLNLPDPGILNDSQVPGNLWNKDTLSNRLAAILEAIHPDFIFLTGDLLLGSSSSESTRMLREALIQATRENPAGTKTKKAHGAVAPSQRSARVFVDDGGPTQKFRFDGSMKPKFSNRTAAQIGADAVTHYLSYRTQGPKLTNSARGYTLAYPKIKPLPISFNSGVAVVPPHLKTLSDEIMKLTRGLDGRKSGDALFRLDLLVGKVDSTVQTVGGGLPPHDQGILARWKNGLEDLRSALLGVNVDFTLSDSLVTDNQLFVLNFNSFKPALKGGSTSIYIPKSSNIEWIVNESLTKSFPFDGQGEFRILTPGRLAKNTPAASQGLTASRMRTNFLFMIVHRDTVRARSFIYRKEIPLRIAPLQSFELPNDIVVASQNNPLTFWIQNVSRDLVGGLVSVHDSVVHGGPKSIQVKGKTEFSDTLQLSWKEDLPFGDYTAKVWTSKKEVGRFRGRKFPCEVNNPGTIGIVSSIAHSSLEQAVRNLGLMTNGLTPDSDGVRSLSELHIAIIDRDAFAADQLISKFEHDLWQWVNDGGRLILLPQFHAPSPPFADRPIPRFEEGVATPPGAEVMVDTSHSLTYIPNRLNMDDWSGWIFSTAYGSLNVSGTASEVLLRAKDSGSPLLTSTRVGKGTIICVALNMDAQWTNVVPGAYRLLANIVGAK